MRIFTHKKWKISLFLLVLLTAFQLFSLRRTYWGDAQRNPPVIKEPMWDSEQTRLLARRACFDCHSNETQWPWYSHIVPFSWLVLHDVEEGREHLNFSEWHLPQRHADESADEVEEGEMPLWVYLLFHPEAKLSAQETEQLIDGLRATMDDRAASD